MIENFITFNKNLPIQYMAEWMPRWQSYNLCKDFHDIDTLCMILFLTFFPVCTSSLFHQSWCGRILLTRVGRNCMHGRRTEKN